MLMQMGSKCSFGRGLLFDHLYCLHARCLVDLTFSGDFLIYFLSRLPLFVY